MSPPPLRTTRPATAIALVVVFIGGLSMVATPLRSAGDLGPSRAVSTRVERSVYLMGTRATLVTWASDRVTGRRELDRMLRVLERTEAELSTWREASWLSALNRQPVDRPWRAPASLCALVAELMSWHRATEGAFDPAIGTLVDAWGLRQGGRRPSEATIATAHRRSGLRHLALDEDRCDVTRRGDVRLDAGAFGKGEALDRVTRRGRATGPWLIDLGGQVAVSGAPPFGWSVALAHPRQRHEAVREIRLTEGSLATSGGSERDGRVGSDRVGHIVDPRTGRPVSRVASVVVWHPRALVADVLSTALYVMGPDAGRRWAEARDVAACFIVPTEAGAGQPGAVGLLPTRAFQERFLTPPSALRPPSARERAPLSVRG